MSSNCFCTVLFPKSSQLFGIRVLIFHPNLHGTNVANNSFAQILVSRLCTLDRFQHASLRAFPLRIGYDIILLTCSSHQHATTFSQEVIFCFDVFSLTELEKGSAHARLERHPVKFQKVKEWKVKKYTFRLLDFSTFLLPFGLSTVWVKIQKVKKYTFRLSDFLTFRLFDFSPSLWTLNGLS